MSSRNGARSASPCSAVSRGPCGVAALVELPDERPARLPPGLRRQELPGRRPGADHRPEQLGARAGVHEGLGVARRDLGDHVLGDPEEPAHPVQARRAGRRRGAGSAAPAPARAGSARRGRRAGGRTSPARGSARTAPSPRRPAAPPARRPRRRPRTARGRRPTGASSWSTPGRPGRAAPRRAGPCGRSRGDPPARVAVVEVERRALARQLLVAGVRRTGRGSAAAARSTRGCCARRPGPLYAGGGESPHR